MDFVIVSGEGFLNTNYGIKVVDYVPGIVYKFEFSDGSSTNEITEEVILYKKFNKPGKHMISMSTANDTITKEIEISDTLMFGNGDHQDVVFLNNRDVIIQKKTIGINIFYRKLGHYLTIAFKPDDIFEISCDLLLFIKYSEIGIKHSLVGYFNLVRALVETQLECTIITINKGNKKLLYATEEQLTLIYDGVETNFDGKYVTISQNRKYVFYEYEDALVQLDFDVLSSYKIKNSKNLKLTKAPDLLYIDNLDTKRLWNMETKSFIMDNPPDDLVFFESSSFINGLALKDYLTFYNSAGNIEFQNYEQIQVRPRELSSHLIIQMTEAFILIPVNSFSHRLIVPHTYIGDISSDLIAVKTQFGNIGYYSIHDDNLIEIEGEPKFSFQYDSVEILVVYRGQVTGFYSCVDNQLKELISYEGMFTDTYKQILIDYGIVWIVQGYSIYKAYKGFTDEVLATLTIKKMYHKWLWASDLSFTNIETLERIDQYPDDIFYIRNDLSEVVQKREEGWYLITRNNKSLTELIVFDSDLKYNQSELHPNGKTLILNNGFKTELVDLFTGKITIIEASTFLALDDNKITLECVGDFSKVRIVDPVTFELIEITRPAYLMYKYYSRDETLRSDSWGKRGECFDTISIFDSTTNINNDINIASSPTYINSIAFSRENSFIAYSGKISWSNGVVEILKLRYPMNSQTDCRRITAYYCDSVQTSLAIWKVVFSPTEQLIAFYDSDPHTWVYKYDWKGILTVKDKFDNRSVECFSPDGRFLVLSQHRYEALTHGGSGWCPSNNIYLMRVRDWQEVKQFEEHHDQIVYANISVDGTKMISRSNDGIVIVRPM